MCHVCGHVFKTFKNLHCHYKTHLNSKQFCCTTCNLQFNNSFGLKKHIRQQHKDLFLQEKTKDSLKTQQKCPKCKLWLSSSLVLKVHMRTHLPFEERMKVCPDCSKVFVNT